MNQMDDRERTPLPRWMWNAIMQWLGITCLVFVMMTAPDGEIVFVNPQAVVAIVPRHDKPLYGMKAANTELYLSSGNSLYVKETPAEAELKLR